MWNLFTVGSLQFPNDSTTASVEANQNRPKVVCLFRKSCLFISILICGFFFLSSSTKLSATLF